MKLSCALFVAAASAAAIRPKAKPDADGRYTLEAEGIKAQFIPYGATLTNLFVKGKDTTVRSLGVSNNVCRQGRHRA